MIRYDTTKWLTHFVHKKNTDGYNALIEGGLRKFQENARKNGPFSVLKQILTDGYLKCSWSERSGKRTIYGPKPAICFTEMPLGAILEYVKQRDPKYVSEYGIAFLKEELFRAGTRPVIYGLTSDPVEEDIDGFRNLSSTSGISLNEQYRYVATNLGGKINPIDWTHEREWRWVDNLNWFEDMGIKGLPFSIKRSPYKFNKVIIMVKTSKEKEELLTLLQKLPGTESTSGGELFHFKSKCENIEILDSETWEEIFATNKTLKLEDLGYI
ncbi:hypothetical protein [Dyadobacter frigoris]|uniref:DUF2971 domain-containing protein n=1 Tax=Dyadobacter frigoris TaxID=2576211 RepID=A0A4U6CRY3_9BACT|nr:hypothetical protein [Dyadobacter frigoris]TKT86247.1 hypothetical protein FDK13_32560 [Dyadobacter frigoris]GLU56912.1 hypothetical protein Dfri01_63730 [Dyadobacter frigoris]